MGMLNIEAYVERLDQADQVRLMISFVAYMKAAVSTYDQPTFLDASEGIILGWTVDCR